MNTQFFGFLPKPYNWTVFYNNVIQRYCVFEVGNSFFPKEDDLQWELVDYNLTQQEADEQMYVLNHYSF